MIRSIILHLHYSAPGFVVVDKKKQKTKKKKKQKKKPYGEILEGKEYYGIFESDLYTPLIYIPLFPAAREHLRNVINTTRTFIRYNYSSFANEWPLVLRSFSVAKKSPLAPFVAPFLPPIYDNMGFCFSPLFPVLLLSFLSSYFSNSDGNNGLPSVQSPYLLPGVNLILFLHCTSPPDPVVTAEKLLYHY